MNKHEIYHEELKNLYSASGSNVNKVHMDKLFPSDNEGCINFGYWKSKKKDEISIEERIYSQKVLYEKIFTLLPKKKFKTILEIGCGRGHGVYWLNKKNIDCYGIDAFKEQVNKCKKNYPKISNKYYQGVAEQINFESNFFDGIFSIEATQHFISFKDFAKEAYRVLKFSGVLCITTYFFNSQKSKYKTNQFIPNSIEGTHNAIILEQAINYLIDAGFSLDFVKSIGNNVFPKYADWQTQNFASREDLGKMANDEKWKNYYTGGGSKKHPWLLAYNQNLLDYYIIKAKKKKS